MRFLSQAWLNNNAFTGTIPNMSNSTHLFDLQLHSNGLIGLVPSSLFSLPSLTNISLDNNNLEGPIPMFHKRVKATWESNNFCRSNVGPCDPQVMVMLEIFAALGHPEFSRIKGNDVCTDGVFLRCRRGKIVSVDFRGQYLNGAISPAFSNLTSLVNLTLTNNNFTGSIPKSLTTLPQLQLLDVSRNNLSGQIPKFSSKVKLITRGNAFLGLNVSRQGEGEKAAASRNGGPSKTKVLIPLWIVDLGYVWFQRNYKERKRKERKVEEYSLFHGLVCQQ
ncbi:putative non-specific serine/threonine protein kinase [Medicago truncatula]|uniref:Putative non-specific serine/threonine protein kinase n=1 Tax=Medicago truncatula TaxID=3880 RepID=A0A396H6A9_MEDTR|nr:putative non-specific serine/threonine protein kinase [Medicago truncatula]